MQTDRINAFADELLDALRQRRTIAPLSTREAGITLDDAYRISVRMLERRVAQGERVVGKKIGVTSEAVQQMLGVHQPDFGFLTDRMQVADGTTVSLAQSGLIQPRAEGEIAFVLKQDLRGPGITREDVLDATLYVRPCFEIVDSRIRDWQIRIEDTVADNASSGVFVLGDACIDPRALDLAAVQLRMRRNGKAAGTGLGAAVQGHPAQAVAWLANTLGALGIPFLAGETILSGSLVPLVPVAAGDLFDLQIDGMGGASVRFAV
jgi:2-oxopent-4-enoate/cis-2-oxohex-4-enoate hydratase